MNALFCLVLVSQVIVGEEPEWFGRFPAKTITQATRPVVIEDASLPRFLLEEPDQWEFADGRIVRTRRFNRAFGRDAMPYYSSEYAKWEASTRDPSIAICREIYEATVETSERILPWPTEGGNVVLLRTRVMPCKERIILATREWAKIIPERTEPMRIEWPSEVPKSASYPWMLRYWDGVQGDLLLDEQRLLWIMEAK